MHVPPDSGSSITTSETSSSELKYDIDETQPDQPRGSGAIEMGRGKFYTILHPSSFPNLLGCPGLIQRLANSAWVAILEIPTSSWILAKYCVHNLIPTFALRNLPTEVCRILFVLQYMLHCTLDVTCDSHVDLRNLFWRGFQNHHKTDMVWFRL